MESKLPDELEDPLEAPPTGNVVDVWTVGEGAPTTPDSVTVKDGDATVAARPPTLPVADTRSNSPDVTQPDPERFGPYRVRGVLGKGGMAEVRVAVEERPDGSRRFCALKRLLDSLKLAAAAREMFLEETRLSRLLDHPNIVAVYGSGEIDGRLYIALELIDGVTLSELERLALPEQIPLPVVLEIATGVADALAYAHAMRSPKGRPLDLVHRDVSPQNVLMGRDGAVKLADFGIARFEGRLHQTRQGLVKGKLRYMSPEQRSGRPVDRRTDIFALGLLITRLVAERGAFDPWMDYFPALEMLVRRVTANRAPEQLIELLTAMTAVDRNARLDCARSVADVLRSVRSRLSATTSLAAYLGPMLSHRPAFEGGRIP